DVPHRVWTRTADSCLNGRMVRCTELGAHDRDDFVCRGAGMSDGGSKLTTRANHRNPHQAALSIANIRIRSSSNTPSQRATTAVAMQLPITLTAVRPMSIT